MTSWRLDLLLLTNAVKGETSVAAAPRKHGLTVAEVEEWRDCLMLVASRRRVPP